MRVRWPEEFVGRVQAESLLAAAGLGALLAAVGGATVAAGALLGAGIASANFALLGRRVARLTAVAGLTDGRGAGARFAAGAGLRLGGAVLVLAAGLAAGWVHPVGIVAGVSALPLVLVVRGLAPAREGREPA